LVALGLGFFQLADKGLWVDEAVSLRFALQPAATWFLDNNMALFYALLSVVVRVFGDGERALRGLSALSFAASVPLFYALLRRALSANVARIGAVLFVANAYLLHFAREARGYMLAVLLVIAASYALLRLSEENSTRWAIVYGLTIGLASYAHAFALWVLFAHGLSALWLIYYERRLLPRLSLGFGLATVFAVPLVLRAIAAGASQISWIARPTLSSCLELCALFAGGNGALAGMFGALWLWFVVSSVRVARAEPASDAFARVLLVSWFLVPVASTLLLSRLVTPLVHPKYLLVALPALLAGVAVSLAELPRRVQRAGAVLVLLVLSAHGVYDWYAHYEKELWREAVTFLCTQRTATDALLLDLRAPEPFDYYALRATQERGKASLPAPLVPDRPFGILWGDDIQRSERETQARIDQAGRIWLVRNRGQDGALRRQVERSHRLLSAHVFEPNDGDQHSLFADSSGRILYIDLFVRSIERPAAHTPASPATNF
jgi:hypothetical protein